MVDSEADRGKTKAGSVTLLTHRLNSILRFASLQPKRPRGPDKELTLIMLAAAQQLQGTMVSALPARSALVAVAFERIAGTMPAKPGLSSMTAPPHPAKPREFFIQGITKDGRAFRPSDWAERLASAMACFRPEGGAGGIGAFIGYSPFCVPTVVGGVKAVIVNEALRGIEPMAWDFVMNFARDNELQLGEVSVSAQQE